MINNYLDFNFSLPTNLSFGKNSMEYLNRFVLENNVTSVLIIYGSGSVFSNGSIDDVRLILNNNNVRIIEYKNCPQNPTNEFVNNSKSYFENNKIDLILAIGGGSVIDAAKAIAIFNSNNFDDIWLFNVNKANMKKNKFSIGVILTTSGTSSEINGGFVINNTKLSQKIGFSHSSVRPTFAICNPVYTMTLPRRTTFSNLTDIFSHLLEQFLNNDIEELNIIDQLLLGFARGLHSNSYKLLEDINSYQNRYELMLSSTLGLSYIFSLGKKLHWSLHYLEHELSGMHQIPHSLGIAALTSGYIRFLEEIKYNDYKLNNLNKLLFNNDFSLSINIGNWYKEMDLPSNLYELSKIYNFDVKHTKNRLQNLHIPLIDDNTKYNIESLIEFL
jgi:alcohol dehydrogenase YqhD (iron-dependent ADH family)